MQHFEGLRDILFSEVHLDSEDTASCMLDGCDDRRDSTNVISSTYLKALMLEGGAASFIIERKIGGPKRVPWGTPACMDDQSDSVSWYLTF